MITSKKYVEASKNAEAIREKMKKNEEEVYASTLEAIAYIDKYYDVLYKTYYEDSKTFYKTIVSHLYNTFGKIDIVHIDKKLAKYKIRDYDETTSLISDLLLCFFISLVVFFIVVIPNPIFIFVSAIAQLFFNNLITEIIYALLFTPKEVK